MDDWSIRLITRRHHHRLRLLAGHHGLIRRALRRDHVYPQQQRQRQRSHRDPAAKRRFDKQIPNRSGALRLDALHHARIKSGPRFGVIRRSQLPQCRGLRPHGRHIAPAFFTCLEVLGHGSHLDSRHKFLNVISH